MIRIENTEVYGWGPAIRGMRNPMNSWDKSDTRWVDGFDAGIEEWVECDMGSGFVRVIGNNDANLMRRLCNGGPVHAKFRRMIGVWVDIEAPLYWWKEFDTYKVGTTANSCSTMHKIHAEELTLDDFSHEHLSGLYLNSLKSTITMLNDARAEFIETKDKDHWWDMIQLLPTSYNQRRTVSLNYEVLVGMYRDRKNHKLDEWHTFCDWVERLPYSWLITGKENEDGET